MARGQIHWPSDGHGVLQVERRGDVDRAGGEVHLRSDGDRVAGGAAVHGGGDGRRVGDGRCRGGVVVPVVCVFIRGMVEGSLAMSLEVTRDVGSTEHLATDVAGHLTLVADHVGAQSVFGGKG